MSSSNNTFVFVVCGDDQHISTLNFSLRSLRKFSGSSVLVVTDPERNNIAVEHDRVVAVRTPSEMDHHQASIFLKTGLHRILPAGKKYCYLDSDVVAVKKGVDSIFEQMIPPVTFASDHCTLEKFSPNAVRCSCANEKAKESAAHSEMQKQLNDLIKKNIPKFCPGCPYLKSQEVKLRRDLRKMLLFPPAYFPGIFSFVFDRYVRRSRFCRLNSEFSYDRIKKSWFDSSGHLIKFPGSDNYTFEAAVSIIEKGTHFRYNFSEHYWTDDSGNKIFDAFQKQPECGHLGKAISDKFGIQAPGYSWQHWNGGVFLFDDRSREFLDTWHALTLEIFKDPYWKTRDQGTLVATVWKFGLQNHPKLPAEYNFIADYYTDGIGYDKRLGFTRDHFRTAFDPFFVHVYHNWGKKGWDIWDAVADIA